jgi:hypothetical protein
MARPIVYGGMEEPSRTKVQPDLSERRLRQVSAWLMLYLLLQAELGLAWDRQWHDLVGRDRFWIPPHIMLYTGIGAAGLIALCLVLIDTLRYRRKAPGVDDSSTIRVLWLFHAPLGFVLLGFGTLIDLLAAPFDNYWHELYGIDVTLWSPFHIMGTIGGIVAGLGLIYAFASEAALEREAKHPTRHFLGLNTSEWGTLLLLAAFMELTLQSLTAFAPLTFGSLNLLTYPFPLACIGGFCLVSAVQITRKRGAATLTVILLCIVALVTQTFVPWALDNTVAAFGLSFRFSGRQPTFNATLALMPLLFLVFALLVDGVAYWQRRRSRTSDDPLRGAWLLGALLALPAVIVPAWIVQALMALAPVIPLPPIPPDVARVIELRWSDLPLTLPFTLAGGAITATLGAALGDIWYLSQL